MRLESVTGIGPALLRRIRERWPDLLDTPELKDDPYLLTQVRGIGFMLADRVARATGIAVDAPQRINAAGVHVLSEAEQAGHTCLPLDNFVSQLQSALGVGGFSRELDFDDRRIILNGDLIARRSTDFAEHVVATKFARLAGAQDGEWTGPNLKALAGDQMRAAMEMCGKSIFALLGGPGTGKTYTIRQLIEGRRCSFALCAPTGKAAKRIEELSGEKAQTIHRLLGVVHPDSAEYRSMPDAHSRGFRFRHNARQPLDRDLVILDEASMCDVRLMADLCDALRPGARLVLVGDPFQLPAVGPGAILRDLCQAQLPHFELTELKRQDPSLLIARNCKSIRYEKRVSINNRGATDFFFLETQDPKAAQALIVDMVSKRLPAKYGFDRMSEIVTITALREKGELSRKELNIALRAKLNPDAVNSPKPTVGDRVIQLSNNYDLDMMNGDIGTILEFNLGAEPITLGEHEVKPGEIAIELDVPDGRVVVAPWEEFDIDLAYALTVHKFQGSEAPAVVVAIHEQQGAMVPTAQWLYTAISRARKVCVVVGSRGALEQAAIRHRDTKRFTRLGTFLKENAAD